MNQTIAVFDFDGTLFKGISGIKFFKYLVGPKKFYSLSARHFLWYLLFLAPRFSEYAFNKISSSFLKGRSIEEVTQKAINFSKERIKKWKKNTAFILLPSNLER